MTDKSDHPLNVNGEPRAFFGRRSGKRLHKGQDRLYAELLPALQIALPDATLDLDTLFPSHPRRAIEIGYGGGEHLSRVAGENPDTGFIGCEVFSGGVAKLLEAVEERELTNIRLFTDDALKLLVKRCRRRRWTRPGCSIPTPGRRRATTSAASFRRPRWPNSRGC